jgi:hypothetical protein
LLYKLEKFAKARSRSFLDVGGRGKVVGASKPKDGGTSRQELSIGIYLLTESRNSLSFKFGSKLVSSARAIQLE